MQFSPDLIKKIRQIQLLVDRYIHLVDSYKIYQNDTSIY